MNLEYKKYSLENLERWLEDSINSGGASPQEIYDVIKKVVEDNYYTYKHKTGQCYELLALLNGNGVGHVSYEDGVQEEKTSPTYDDMIAEGSRMTDDGFWIKETDETITSGASVSPKQNKWVLLVQQKIEEGIDNYFIQLPDDLLEQVNWKENDQLIWIDCKDGTFELRKA